MRNPWRATFRSILASAAIVVAASCGGGGGSPSGPSGGSGAPSAPSNIRINSQRILFTSNEISLAWDGNGSSYRLAAGTAPGGSESLSIEVSGNSYNWSAPRTEAVYFFRVQAIANGQTSNSSVELPIYTADMRNIIDALFFRSGPMSVDQVNPASNPFGLVWPDGTRIRVVVSNEAGEPTRANAQRFADDYAAVLGGAITASTEMTSDTFANVSLGQVPELTIYTRVLNPFCGAGAIACAFYGPPPLGPNRSIINLAAANNGPVATEHEMGHAFGLGHVRSTAALRTDVNFMMNPSYQVQHMSEGEKTALATARATGAMRPGWRRNDALAAGLVLPTPSALIPAYGGLSMTSGPFAPSLCNVEKDDRWR